MITIIPYQPQNVENFLTSLGHIEAGGVTEVRIFPKNDFRGGRTIHGKRVFIGKTVSGYYDDASKLAQDVAPFDGHADIYVTLNPVKPDLLARAANRLEYAAETTTSDADILADLWFPFDLDPVRPAKISSTDEELELTRQRCLEVCEFLNSFGITPIVGMSGNGYHGLIRLSGYPNTEETAQLKERLTQFLAEKFSSERVKYDATVFNMARIWKLYGVMAVKGDHLPERPHRRARIEIPDELPEPVDLYAMIDRIIPAGWQPESNRTRTTHRQSRANSSDYPLLDVERYLPHHGYSFQVKNKDGRTIYILDQCPFNPNHNQGEVCITQDASGKLGFKCFHNSCAGKTWSEAREAIGDPKPFYQGSQTHSNSARNGEKHKSRHNPSEAQVQAAPSEPSEEPQKILKGPPFPASAWRGVFEVYRRGVHGKNEVCDAYHFAMLKSVAGIIFGRTAYIYTGRYLYPNFYTCLIGTTGLSRKTTALDLGRTLLGNTDPNVISFSGLATPEGLLSKLQIPAPEDDAESNEAQKLSLFMQARIDATSSYEGFRALIGLSEYAALLKKSKKSASDGLIQMLTEAYDCPLALENPTRYAPLKAVKPCVSLVALSTHEWLEESLDLVDIRGGFANRFCYYLHELTRPIPHPSEPDTLGMNAVVKHLHDLRMYLQKKHVRFDFDEETSHFVDEWYHENWYAIANERNELVRDAIQRLDTNARKLALLYAILENDESDCQIHIDQFKAAVEVATYWKNATVAIFGGFATDTQARNENKLVDRLSQRPRTRRQLQQSVGGLMSSKAFNDALDALLRAERVLEVDGMLAVS